MNINATRQSDMVSGLLAEYALGGLSTPARVLVESHLELSPNAERWLDDIHAVGATLARKAGKDAVSFEPHVFDQVEPVDFEDGAAALQSVFAKIDAHEASNPASPRALEQFLGMPVADVPWKKVIPGLAEYKLPDVDGAEVSLLRIDGGKGMPVHTHHGSEVTLVLQGGFSDGNGHYGVGDIAYADDDVNHKPVADPGEVCICFAVVDAPVELTGPIGRLMNSFIR
ncbi:MAG: ChrR family anti-sigma-E factor [Hyphomicrobiales bacterium]